MVLIMSFGNEPMFKLLIYSKQQKQSVYSAFIYG